MHGLRRRIGSGIAIAGLLTIGLGLTAAPSYAGPPKDCNGVYQGNPGGTLHISNSVPPVGSPVAPGDLITVTAEWSTSDWALPTLDKVDACVRIAGADIDTLGNEEKPALNDGSFQHSFTVPAGTPVATGVVCVRVGVHGQPSRTDDSTPSTQKSTSACFDVVAASTGGGDTGGGDTDGGDTGGDTTTGGDETGDRSNDGGTTGGSTGGGNNTQVEGTSVTQTGGNNSTGGSTNNATQINPTTEVAGINFDAGNTTVGETLAASNSGAAVTTSQSGSALPATAGAIEPESLASTGSATQTLLLMAGMALLLGGLAFSFSSPRRAIA